MYLFIESSIYKKRFSSDEIVLNFVFPLLFYILVFPHNQLGGILEDIYVVIGISKITNSHYQKLSPFGSRKKFSFQLLLVNENV